MTKFAIDAAIVDLDGTMVDTLDDFVAVLLRHGCNHRQPAEAAGADAVLDRLDQLQTLLLPR